MIEGNSRKATQDYGEVTGRTDVTRGQRTGSAPAVSSGEQKQGLHIGTTTSTQQEHIDVSGELMERGERRERMSDVELGGLLAAVGNHEGKALLLASMKSGRGYSADGLNRLVSPSGTKTWNSRTIFDWCAKSLAPIGLVTQEIIDPDKGIVGYEVTEKGQKLGASLSGHLLEFSERHPDVSLGALLGSAVSNAKERTEEGQDGQQTSKIRAPLTTFRFFSDIVNRDLPVRREDVISALINNYSEDYEHVSASNATSSTIDRLVGAGILSFASVAANSPYASYENRAERPSDPPPEALRWPTLTNRIDAIISQTEGALGRQEIYDRLLQMYPHYQDQNPRDIQTNISGVVRHLAKHGYIQPSGEFEHGKQSSLTFTDQKREMLIEFVSIVNKFRTFDAEFLVEGRKKAQGIVTNADRFASLVQKNREASRRTGKIGGDNLSSKIVVLLQTYSQVTTREIQSQLANQGEPYSRAAIRNATRELVKANKLLGIKNGNIVNYSLAPENDQTVEMTEHGSSSETVVFQSTKGEHSRD